MSNALKVAVLLGCALQFGLAAVVIVAVQLDADLGGTLMDWQALVIASAAVNLIGVAAWFTEERIRRLAAVAVKVPEPSRPA